MFGNSPDPFSEILVEFWPSKEELVDDGSDLYLKELTGFYHSLSTLRKETQTQRVYCRPYTDAGTDRGRDVSRNAPPLVVEWVFGIATAGAAAYYLLKLWLAEYKGRQVRIITQGLEVEVTHCSDEQFEALLEILRKHNEELCEARRLSGPMDDLSAVRGSMNTLREKLVHNLTSHGIPVRTTAESNKPEEMQDLRAAQTAKDFREKVKSDPSFLERLTELGMDVEELKDKWMPQEPGDYDIALSFAGEDRPVVESIAKMLRDRGVRVFYDKFEEADLWGKDLYEHLAKVYAKRATFCVVFASNAYVTKKWTSHERRHAQARALEQNSEYILPIRLDDTDVPGIPSTTAYLDLRRISESQVVDSVIKKLSSDSGWVPAGERPS